MQWKQPLGCDLEDASGEVLDHAQMTEWMTDIGHAANKLSAVRKQVDTFRQRLSDEYGKTYS